jgi:hypothetical protein
MSVASKIEFPTGTAINRYRAGHNTDQTHSDGRPTLMKSSLLQPEDSGHWI